MVRYAKAAVAHSFVAVFSHMSTVQLLPHGILYSTFARVSDQKGIMKKVKEEGA